MTARPDRVWIDFVCYNQHVVGSIALNMEQVIGEIGQIGFLCSPIPLLGRSWCLWELLNAGRVSASTQVYVRAGYRNDKILATNALKRSFVGVRESQTTVRRDHEEICGAFLAHFGSFEAADAHVKKLIEEHLSAPMFELHERDEALRFRPYPFFYDGGTDEAGRAVGIRQWRTFNPYYSRYLRSSLLLGTSDEIFGRLIDAGLHVSDQERRTRELKTASPRLVAAFRAAEEGDNEALVTQVADGIDVNTAVLLGSNLLSTAARKGHARTVEKLLAMGASVDAVPPDKITALLAGAQSGDAETVSLLLAAGADPQLAGPHDYRPLHVASLRGHERVARVLIDAGAAVAQRAEHEATPLHMAADGGHLGIVRLLLSLGALVDDANADGWTAFFWAAASGHVPVLQELADHGADINVVALKASATPLHLATQHGHFDVVRWLLEAGAAPGPLTEKRQTPLHVALREGNLDIAQLLLDHGAPTGLKDAEGETPLTLALKQEMPDSVIERLRSGNGGSEPF